MLYLGYKRYLHFRIVNTDSVPVLGLLLSDFELTYRHNNIEQSLDGFQLTENGEGRYCLSYTPAAVGTDFIELYHASSDIRIQDSEDIVSDPYTGSENTTYGVPLDHNYGGQDELRVLEDRPQDFKLYIYLSADWDLNKRSDDDAVGITSLDSGGRWLAKIPVSPEKYHIVLKKFRTVIVFRPYLQVS